MKPGQILVNKNGEKRKILGVCGEAIIISRSNEFEFAMYPATKKELQNMGWSLLEEPWVPKIDEMYRFLNAQGHDECTRWNDQEDDNFKLSLGNVFVLNDYDGIKKYKQKLVERMGRKEN